MNTKTLYYREICEAPKLRATHKKAIENRDKNKLDLACDFFNDQLRKSIYSYNPNLVPSNLK